MSLFTFFNRRSSAPVARERLQILLAHERATGQSDLVATLQEEILAVIARHMAIERDKVQVKLDRGNAVSTLEIDIEMPSAAEAAAGKAAQSGAGAAAAAQG
jgi:cell division topological specificity factor